MPEVTGYTTTAVDQLIAGNVVGGSIDPATGAVNLSTKDGSVVNIGSVLTGVLDASDTVKGIVELATDVETQAGTDSARAVTPFGMASVVASTSGRGLVELATNAETLAATDTTRAVTPAGLQSVRVVSGIAESAPPSSYPMGTSVMGLSSSTWSLNSGSGIVITDYVDASHITQRFFSNAGGTQSSQTWTRTYHSTNGGGGWTAWSSNTTVASLAPASFTQTTAFTAYPLGTSRLVFNSSNAATWDFNGKTGEVVTYTDGTYAVQTWRAYNSGSTNYTEMWIRSADSVNGWTKWTWMTKAAVVIKGQLISSSVPTGVSTIVVTLPSGRTMGDLNYIVQATVTEKNDGSFGQAAVILYGAYPASANTFRIQINNTFSSILASLYISYICIPTQG